MALVAACLFGGVAVISKVALRHSPPYTGTVVFAVVAVLFVAPWTPWWLFLKKGSWEGTLWFFLSGIVHPGLAVTLFLIGSRRLGVSRTTSISSAAPLIGVIVGVIILGERPGVAIWLGGLCIVAGIVAISGEKPEGAFEAKDLLYPLLSGFAFGLAPVLRKLGLNHIPSIPYGVGVAGLGGLIGLGAVVRAFPEGERLRLERRGLPLFALAASLALVARLLFFDALKRGDFSRVVFLINTTPVFVLLLSWVALRGSERLTPRLVGGTVAVVVGVWAVTMGSDTGG